MSDDYKEKFQKLVREEEEKARKQQRFEKNCKRVAKKFVPEIMRVCSKFAQVKGWRCQRNWLGSRGWYNANGETYYVGVVFRIGDPKWWDWGDKIDVDVRFSIHSGEGKIGVSFGPCKGEVPFDKFSEGRLAEKIVELYKCHQSDY